MWSVSLLLDGSLVRGEYIGVTLEMGEGGEGVQLSELLNLEIVLYIVVLEIMSDSMLDDV